MKHEPLRIVQATRIERSIREDRNETLADETPIALVYNGRSHAVMMATPGDLDDFAYGFTLAEGIVDDVGEIEIVDRLYTAHGISLQMLIPQRRYDRLRDRERNLTGRTGCGLCGAATLEAAMRPIRRVTSTAAIATERLPDAFARLIAAQPLNDRSGALHAAALIMSDGPMLVREDVGRHNAVDKALGAAAMHRDRPRALLVTSRASYEVIHKAAQRNCPVVAAVSAPTALAVRFAEEAGITLIGFARGNRMTVYSHP
ncbi:formate dehydrogenase accessory sulfurtransferase FdhD [Solimonas terrae]|uniref:Sulfur carrier protein FdhD n=1 Tax=Solimonas terrae TaxID=1396819 RepID=A0A6M2BND9_9GAMM|nr:formate dehydrogenase accessory sulfurtransferase FdhD [Solimonas terrae]NGY04126.1 formate dehydrogenase accessory sulfurtransferase FdhD [Solimonas terrae]